MLGYKTMSYMTTAKYLLISETSSFYQKRKRKKAIPVTGHGGL
jgi:hypothetical protein